MALKLIVDTVPEGLEDYYKDSDDGSFELDVEKMDDNSDELNKVKSELKDVKTKVSEFRNSNVKLRSQLEKAGSAPDDFNLDDAINAAVDDALLPMKKKNDKLLGENLKLNNTLEEVVLADNVKDIAINHGVAESALPDIVSRARVVFTVKEGKPVPKDLKKNRDEEGNVLTPESWIKQLTDSAPHLFKDSSGSGASRPVNGQATVARSSTDKINAGLQKLT